MVLEQVKLPQLYIATTNEIPIMGFNYEILVYLECLLKFFSSLVNQTFSLGWNLSIVDYN